MVTTGAPVSPSTLREAEAAPPHRSVAVSVAAWVPPVSMLHVAEDSLPLAQPDHEKVKGSCAGSRAVAVNVTWQGGRQLAWLAVNYTVGV